MLGYVRMLNFLNMMLEYGMLEHMTIKMLEC